jgi:hypothetical protein
MNEKSGVSAYELVLCGATPPLYKGLKCVFAISFFGDTAFEVKKKGNVENFFS